MDKQRGRSRPVGLDDAHLGIMQGTVKSFGNYTCPGIGHICDAVGNDYFVHYTDIAGTGFRNLEAGRRVTFKAYRGPKGLYAKEVLVLPDA